MMIFVESPLFTKLVDSYLTDDEYSKVQAAIMTRPETAPIVRGSGGVRKLRWTQPGRGKRGGVRIIYYVKHSELVWMLTLYAKNEAATIPGHVLAKIREALEE